jgi:hypothetical protein
MECEHDGNSGKMFRRRRVGKLRIENRGEEILRKTQKQQDGLGNRRCTRSMSYDAPPARRMFQIPTQVQNHVS